MSNQSVSGGPLMYGWSGIAGLAGQDYYGLLAQANLQTCDSRDTACISNNVAKEAVVEDTWVKYEANPGGAPDDLKLSFAPQTDAQVREFSDPNNIAWGGNVVDTRGIMSSSLAPPPAPVYSPPAPAPVRTPVGRQVTRTSTPGVQTMIGGPAASAPGATSWALPDSVSSFPWYVWAGGAAVAFFALKGGR